MDWFAPGIPPTGRELVVPTVGIVAFEGGKIASEHIYWDQAT
jgi:carboxymethylenebutenolidase